MEIIYRGVIPKVAKYEIECPTCKSRMLCTKDELPIAGSQYNISYHSYVCPVCGTKNYIDEIDLEEKKVLG